MYQLFFYQPVFEYNKIKNSVDFSFHFILYVLYSRVVFRLGLFQVPSMVKCPDSVVKCPDSQKMAVLKEDECLVLFPPRNNC